MKKNFRFLFLIALLIAAVSVFNACKKQKENTPAVDPVFTVTATTVLLQTGGDGLQFSAKSTNTDVKMTKVIITSPVSSHLDTFNLNGNSFAKNQTFNLQETTTAYNKETGTWQFNFSGTRPADNVAFAVNTTCLVN